MLAGIGAGLQLGWRRLLLRRPSGCTLSAAALFAGRAEAEVADRRDRVATRLLVRGCSTQRRQSPSPRSSNGFGTSLPSAGSRRESGARHRRGSP